MYDALLQCGGKSTIYSAGQLLGYRETDAHSWSCLLVWVVSSAVFVWWNVMGVWCYAVLVVESWCIVLFAVTLYFLIAPVFKHFRYEAYSTRLKNGWDFVSYLTLSYWLISHSHLLTSIINKVSHFVDIGSGFVVILLI